MNPLLFLLLCFLFYLGLSDTPLQSYSHQATAIVTQSDCQLLDNGQYRCSSLVTYNTSPYTMETLVPLHATTDAPILFGQTPVIYYNPNNPKQISHQRFVPADQRKLFFVIIALLLILFSFQKKLK